jgi:hypothetical protein
VQWTLDKTIQKSRPLLTCAETWVTRFSMWSKDPLFLHVNKKWNFQIFQPIACWNPIEMMIVYILISEIRVWQTKFSYIKVKGSMYHKCLLEENIWIQGQDNSNYHDYTTKHTGFNFSHCLYLLSKPWAKRLKNQGTLGAILLIWFKLLLNFCFNIIKFYSKLIQLHKFQFHRP